MQSGCVALCLGLAIHSRPSVSCASELGAEPIHVAGSLLECLFSFAAARRRYVSREEMRDEDAPLGQPYLAGWGYVLSRDVAEHLLRRVDRLTRHPEEQPGAWLVRSGLCADSANPIPFHSLNMG